VEQFSKQISLCLFAVVAIVVASPLWAQPAVRFPQSITTVYQSGTFSQPGSGIAPPAGASPPSTLGTPNFDPFSRNPGAASMPPALNTAPQAYGAAAPPPGTLAPYPGTTTNGMGAAPAAPYGVPPAQPYGAQPYGAQPYGAQPYGSYPPGAVPGNTPNAMLPGGWNTGNWSLPATRFMTPRLRYTYVDGGKAADDLGIHDFDSSVAVAFPNFLYSTQPLYVVPSFSLHLWQGPQTPYGDLPGNAYSAFLDFGWSTDPTKPLSGEVGVRLGVFTDFNTFNTNSGRIMGQGLFRLTTTPTTALRGGVVYINRNKLKLLPAFGLLWTPNSQTRFDIYFPRPKLAQHLTTAGNHDVWWYIGGEYGGGAWTVQRAAGFSDRIDINDIRLTLGIEWGQSSLLQQGRRTGFFEAGWVTSREVVYVATPDESADLRDSFMLRIGWNY